MLLISLTQNLSQTKPFSSSSSFVAQSHFGMARRLKLSVHEHTLLTEEETKALKDTRYLRRLLVRAGYLGSGLMGLLPAIGVAASAIPFWAGSGILSLTFLLDFLASKDIQSEKLLYKDRKYREKLLLDLEIPTQHLDKATVELNSIFKQMEDDKIPLTQEQKTSMIRTTALRSMLDANEIDLKQYVKYVPYEEGFDISRTLKAFGNWLTRPI